MTQPPSLADAARALLAWWDDNGWFNNQSPADEIDNLRAALSAPPEPAASDPKIGLSRKGKTAKNLSYNRHIGSSFDEFLREEAPRLVEDGEELGYANGFAAALEQAAQLMIVESDAGCAVSGRAAADKIRALEPHGGR